MFFAHFQRFLALFLRLIFLMGGQHFDLVRVGAAYATCVTFGCARLSIMFALSSQSVASELHQNGFPTGAEFFPIGVWLQSPRNAPEYRALGINTFVGLWKGPTEAQLALLKRYGMFVIAEQNATALASPNRDIIKAWLYSPDEPDNDQRMGPCVPATEVVRQSREMKMLDPTRPVMVGFGQGVANEFWNGRASCDDDRYYDVAAQAADIVSFDIYPVGSRTPQVKGKLEYVAHGVSNLVEWTRSEQKVWNTLETTALDPDHPVTPDQVRSEVWMSLIHGSTGIIYFVHEFKPKFRDDAIFRHMDVVQEVKSINDLIKSLAPVLNSQSLKLKIDISSTVPIDLMVKRYSGALYVFAIAMKDVPCTATFDFTELATNGDVAVLGENRKISISAGRLRDSFVGYGVHIYKIFEDS